MLKSKSLLKHIIQDTLLKKNTFATPLGPMLAIADNTTLHVLAFTDQKDLPHKLNRIEQVFNAISSDGSNKILVQVKTELHAYFTGNLQLFKTPVRIQGTVFQKATWDALKNIPYGHTRSYHTQAETVGKPTAYRAIANANAANQIAIIIPCHRIIKSNGDLGGYAGGVERKKWLINHEKNTRRTLSLSLFETA